MPARAVAVRGSGGGPARAAEFLWTYTVFTDKLSTCGERGAMGERWLTVLSGGTPSAPPKLLPELAWFDSLEGLEAKAGIKPGTPVVIDLGRLHADPENYRTERVFTEFLRTSRWSRLKQG